MNSEFKKGDKILILPNPIYAPEGLGMVVEIENTYIVYTIQLYPNDPYFGFPFRVYPRYALLVANLTDLEKALHGVE